MHDIDLSLVSSLRRDLDAAGWNAFQLPTLIGPDAVDAIDRQVASPARTVLANVDTAAATLVSVFLLGDAVPAKALATALPTIGIDGVRELGLVTVESDIATSTVAIRPWKTRSGGMPVSWWVVSDHDELSSRIPLPADHVLGVGGAGRTLSALIPSQPIARALDIGSGCGLITLHLAAVAEQVVATDISARALWCTALTCALNGVTNVETRAGSLLEPVVGDTFDLIASNPPFVITPRTDAPVLEYRDGGSVGDGIMESLVRTIPSRLNDDGIAIMLGNWESYAGESGLDRVVSWAGGNSCWVIERETLTPARYAEMWIRDGGILPSSTAAETLYQTWLSDLHDRGVQSIGFGWLLLSKGGDVHRAERLTHQITLAATGDHLAAAFEAMAIVESLTDDELASLHVVTAPDVTEVRHLRPGAADPSAIELRQGGGLARTINAGTGLAALVGALDGDYDVESLVGAIAGIVGVDEVALRAELLPAVRELLVTGMATVYTD